MKTKFKEVQADFYTFSSKTSDIARQLALAGIAIIWIFKLGEKSDVSLFPTTIPILKLLVLCLLSDFCHAFVPSLIYGGLTEHWRRQGKTEGSEVEYSSWWTAPDWIFFILKIVFLIWAYIRLWFFLQQTIM